MNCKQCGELKPMNDFRLYYNGSGRRYNVCNACEKINSRFKYLSKKQTRTANEDKELEAIMKLYNAQSANGLKPPKVGSRSKNWSDVVSDAISKIGETSNIDTWLTKDLAGFKPEYLEDVYDNLLNNYRPAIGLDDDTLLPIYDDTHKAKLDAILKRFDEHEEEYYEME